MEDNRMFGEDSFTDEIDTPGQAEECVEYLALNEHKFRQELQDEGLSYDEIDAALKRVWSNLADSCKRVGYSDSITVAKSKKYGL